MSIYPLDRYILVWQSLLLTPGVSLEWTVQNKFIVLLDASNPYLRTVRKKGPGGNHIMIHKCALLLGYWDAVPLEFFAGAEAHPLDIVGVFGDYAVTTAGSDDGGRWIFNGESRDRVSHRS
jgi:hypothetical protein